MNKQILITAVVFGLISIVLGAFGAHGLKAHLSAESLQSFEVGVKYQMYHALFLLFLGLFNAISKTIKRTIFLLIGIGIVLFSFSIYALSTQAITGINFKPIGFITPIGGLLLILGWIMLLTAIVKIKRI